MILTYTIVFSFQNNVAFIIDDIGKTCVDENMIFHLHISANGLSYLGLSLSALLSFHNWNRPYSAIYKPWKLEEKL